MIILSYKKILKKKDSKMNWLSPQKEYSSDENDDSIDGQNHIDEAKL